MLACIGTCRPHYGYGILFHKSVLMCTAQRDSEKLLVRLGTPNAITASLQVYISTCLRTSYLKQTHIVERVYFVGEFFATPWH